MKVLDFGGAMQVLSKTVKGTRHPYYERVTNLADLYLKLMTGENIDSLLVQFNPREDDEQFEQRKRITKTIVGAVGGKIKGPFEKVARSNNVTKKLMVNGDNSKADLDKLQDSLDSYWGDETLDDFMDTRILDLSFSDPNSFIITEMFKQSSQDELKIFPFEVSSHEAVNFHYTNNSLDFLIVFDGQKRYTMYTKDFSIVLVEKKNTKHKEQKDITVEGELVTIDAQINEIGTQPGQTKIDIGSRTFMIRVVENMCSSIPAIRVGYKRDEMTGGNTYVSPLQKAVPRMEKIIKADSELDLTIALHTFPQKLQYAQRCLGDPIRNEICEGGYLRGKDGAICKKCQGSGFIFHNSAQSAIMYEMPPQDEMNQGAQLPDLDKLVVYKSPDINLIKFQNDYARMLEDLCIKDVFISQNFEKNNGSTTATEINFDMQSIYDTLYPFARKFSSIYKKQVRITACYLLVNEGLKVVHQFPKDFKLKSTDQLLAERKAAEDANAPEFFKKQLDLDIAEKVYHDNPIALNKFKVKQQHMPFAGKTQQQIQDIIAAGRTTKENALLWVEFENIMQSLEDQYAQELALGEITKDTSLSFYDLPYQERLVRITEQLQLLMGMKASELGIGSLALGGLDGLAGADGELSGNEIPRDVDVEAESKAKLRGTVGGVTGIISINQAVGKGEMTEAAAEAMLTEIYGFSEEQAAKLIEPVIIKDPNAIDG